MGSVRMWVVCRFDRVLKGGEEEMEEGYLWVGLGMV